MELMLRCRIYASRGWTMAGSFETEEDDERRETRESSKMEPCCHLIEFLTWLSYGIYLPFLEKDYLCKNSWKVKDPNKMHNAEPLMSAEKFTSNYFNWHFNGIWAVSFRMIRKNSAGWSHPTTVTLSGPLSKGPISPLIDTFNVTFRGETEVDAK
ncbi:unnamed protein product [Vicia faba]|uniref:Uncharacterized protein n=1 Tax=Vicia faba TaxID=3906 RepID=A0AAV0Z6V6_VICFA|nr:unnamed protein product [Vicia faba]